MHHVEEIERRLRILLCSISGLPEEQIASMKELNAAGEPGIALEHLCTQLHEFDIAVSPLMLQEVEFLGRTMKLDRSYWAALRPA